MGCLQIDNDVAKVMSSYPIDEMLRAFGFHVEVIDGHSFDAIEQALNTVKAVMGRPSAIVMKTTKGVSYMENRAGCPKSSPPRPAHR